MEQNKLESCHLVAHSLAGLDARLAADPKYVKSLLTIGTPHK